MTELEDITEITPTIAAKLRKAGILTVEVLAVTSLDVLKQHVGSTAEDKLREVQFAVWKKLGYWFTPATQLAEMRKDQLVFQTGSKALDHLLQGGTRSRVITEFVGEYGTGKTENLATILVLNLVEHPEYTAIWFDTEESFSDIRITEILKARGIEMDPQDLLQRIIYAPIWHTQHFEEMIEQADVIIKARNVKLIFVDSIIATLRAESVGREVLWSRQQTLNKILRKLLNYARAYNLSVVVTNQVSANPGFIFSGNPEERNKPTGGHILAHNAETRLYLRKAKANKRIIKLIDSSWLPPGECAIRITEKGIEDLEADA